MIEKGDIAIDRDYRPIRRLVLISFGGVLESAADGGRTGERGESDSDELDREMRLHSLPNSRHVYDVRHSCHLLIQITLSNKSERTPEVL